MVAQVGQAGRAQAPAARAVLHVLKGLALLADPARDLVEGQAGALAPGHGAGPGASPAEGDASFHVEMIVKTIVTFKPPPPGRRA